MLAKEGGDVMYVGSSTSSSSIYILYVEWRMVINM